MQLMPGTINWEKKPKSKQTNKNMAMLVRGPSREPNTIIL